MNITNLSALFNLLLICAFIADRIYRIRSSKEYKAAKEAQIDTLKQQLELERSNNDIRITELHKQRYENLKMLLDEKELEMSNNEAALLELKVALQDNKEKSSLLNMMIQELDRLERAKLSVEVKRRLFLHQLSQ